MQCAGLFTSVAIGETGSIKVSQNIDLIRAGINYKFGGPAGGRY